MTASSNELYISVDIETSGPIPGEFSMLAVGASIVGEPDKQFYVELVPLNDNFTEEAMTTCDLSLAELRAHGAEPQAAMEQFAAWVQSVRDGRWPIFVGFNAAFDWSFVNYYFIRFGGTGQNPFGHTAIDIKSYYMGAFGTSWAGTSMKRLPPEIHSPDKPLAHNALDDARQQGEIFAKLLQSRVAKLEIAE